MAREGRRYFREKRLPARRLFENYKFDAVRISIADPDLISRPKMEGGWSYGEVKVPETINHRTFKPERDGLFCEVIFGPTKRYECACGKYKGLKYKGTVCERCGVEVTDPIVRRYRMGHIQLAAPVVHIWYFRYNPSRIGYLLDISNKELEKIIYFHGNKLQTRLFGHPYSIGSPLDESVVEKLQVFEAARKVGLVVEKIYDFYEPLYRLLNRLDENSPASKAFQESLSKLEAAVDPFSRMLKALRDHESDPKIRRIAEIIEYYMTEIDRGSFTLGTIEQFLKSSSRVKKEISDYMFLSESVDEVASIVPDQELVRDFFRAVDDVKSAFEQIQLIFSSGSERLLEASEEFANSLMASAKLLFHPENTDFQRVFLLDSAEKFIDVVARYYLDHGRGEEASVIRNVYAAIREMFSHIEARELSLRVQRLYRKRMPVLQFVSDTKKLLGGEVVSSIPPQDFKTFKDGIVSFLQDSSLNRYYISYLSDILAPSLRWDELVKGQPRLYAFKAVSADEIFVEERLVDLEESLQKYFSHHPDFVEFTFESGWGYGAEALRELLERVNINGLRALLRKEMREKGRKMLRRSLRRLEVVEAFYRSGLKPSWMIITALPVIPPDLRPMVPFGGKMHSSDLNELYRKVLQRNSRLKRLIDLKAPEIIIKNEKRMLQEAVDNLIDNEKSLRPAHDNRGRLLKSLTEGMKGKEGRFRQNLLGKRVDYSGRAVITVGPELKLHQCGVPKEMALELFKPFIMGKLIFGENATKTASVLKAKRMVERREEEVYSKLEEVANEHPVLLNRAPTLHRPSIQGFEPVLIEGKAIRLHPLVCPPYNADFDGDQMAIHVPLSPEAQSETWLLMLSTHNILSPASGKPIIAPTQDMVLGIYYLTQEKPSRGGEKPRLFADKNSMFAALDTGNLTLHEKIIIRLESEDGKKYIVETTPGRVIFNEYINDRIKNPTDLPGMRFARDRKTGEIVPFIDQAVGKKDISKIVEVTFRKIGEYETVILLDALKDLGFHYSTFSGTTISMEDLKVPEEKRAILARARAEVAKIEEQRDKGEISYREAHNRILEIWGNATEEVTEKLKALLAKDREGFNPVYMMATSGARGNWDQVRQLSGMRGLMADSKGELIEVPVRSSFKEGLNVLEYFISTIGGRKGLVDTALKTANAGYLTRRLVSSAQDIIVTMEDCGTLRGIRMRPIKKGNEVIVSLKERIVGRVVAEDVYDPETGELIVEEGEVVTPEIAQKIEEKGIEEVEIRSPITCQAPHGICAKCYGWDLSKGKMVSVGEAVGIIAAQSIGEPGTQLTLRTFHLGGTGKHGVVSTLTGFVVVEPEERFREKVKIWKTKEGVRYIIPAGTKLEVLNIHAVWDKNKVKLTSEVASRVVSSIDEALRPIREHEIIEGEIVGELSGSSSTGDAEGQIRAPADGKIIEVGDKYYFVSRGVKSWSAEAVLYKAPGELPKNESERVGEVYYYATPIRTDHEGKVEFVALGEGTTLVRRADGVYVTHESMAYEKVASGFVETLLSSRPVKDLAKELEKEISATWPMDNLRPAQIMFEELHDTFLRLYRVVKEDMLSILRNKLRDMKESYVPTPESLANQLVRLYSDFVGVVPDEGVKEWFVREFPEVRTVDAIAEKILDDMFRKVTEESPGKFVSIIRDITEEVRFDREIARTLERVIKKIRTETKRRQKEGWGQEQREKFSQTAYSLFEGEFHDDFRKTFIISEFDTFVELVGSVVDLLKAARSVEGASELSVVSLLKRMAESLDEKAPSKMGVLSSALKGLDSSYFEARNAFFEKQKMEEYSLSRPELLQLRSFVSSISQLLEHLSDLDRARARNLVAGLRKFTTLIGNYLVVDREMKWLSDSDYQNLASKVEALEEKLSYLNDTGFAKVVDFITKLSQLLFELNEENIYGRIALAKLQDFLESTKEGDISTEEGRVSRVVRFWMSAELPAKLVGKVVSERVTSMVSRHIHPAIRIVSAKDGKVLEEYLMPSEARIRVKDGDRVSKYDILAEMVLEELKTKDITTGLPRVEELFEARRPKNAAVLSEIDGVVDILPPERGYIEIIVRNTETGDEKSYTVPIEVKLRVQPGSEVRAGDPLTEGPIDPHDILRVKGFEELQEFLVNEMQEVYRSQGVTINDKHFEVIIRKMLKKIQIEDPGDSDYFIDQLVDRFEFERVNRELRESGKRPARGRFVLLGISSSIFASDSWVAAAAFQETQKALIEAATKGAIDRLRGVQENVIMGHLIPAGTGIIDYDNLEVEVRVPVEEQVLSQPIDIEAEPSDVQQVQIDSTDLTDIKPSGEE